MRGSAAMTSGEGFGSELSGFGSELSGFAEGKCWAAESSQIRKRPRQMLLSNTRRAVSKHQVIHKQGITNTSLTSKCLNKNNAFLPKL